MARETGAPRLSVWLALCRSLVIVFGLATLAATHTYGYQTGAAESTACTTKWFTQRADHFAYRDGAATFQQRVLTQLKSYKKGNPLFVYFGNEAPVELYVEHSGLMWENYQKFGAGLVFMEHRFYGRSVPKDFACQASDRASSCDLSLLTTEQAMRDYAVILESFRRELKPSAVIGFGGSYGGMLATYMRMKYPNLVDGVIAASAPVLSYLGMDPPYDPNGFARVVTKDAGQECAAKFKSALQELDRAISKKEWSKLSSVFKTCSTLRTKEEALGLLNWSSDHFDYLAMGNFPYPSSYVVDEGMLPAWPVKAACTQLLQHYDRDKLRGLVAAASLYHNATGKAKCFFNSEPSITSGSLRGAMGTEILSRNKIPRFLSSSKRQSYAAQSDCGGSWDWQWCTQHVMPFVKGTAQDMFYPYSGFDLNQARAECEGWFGKRISSLPTWSAIEHGGLKGFQRSLTNVVFSNGLLDPWSAGGILSAKGFDDSVVVVLIPNGAHHLDLMFSHPDDPSDVKAARVVELAAIQRWVHQAKARASGESFPKQRASSDEVSVLQPPSPIVELA